MHQLLKCQMIWQWIIHSFPLSILCLTNTFLNLFDLIYFFSKAEFFPMFPSSLSYFLVAVLSHNLICKESKFPVCTCVVLSIFVISVFWNNHELPGGRIFRNKALCQIYLNLFKYDSLFKPLICIRKIIIPFTEYINPEKCFYHLYLHLLKRELC